MANVYEFLIRFFFLSHSVLVLLEAIGIGERVALSGAEKLLCPKKKLSCFVNRIFGK